VRPYRLVCYDCMGRQAVEIKPGSVGFVIALTVFIVALVMGLVGQMTWPVAGCLMGLAIARML
jgi:hypothetical protein